MAEQITDSTFDAEVLNSKLPVLVDFWAPWCGPCRAVGPIVEELALEYQGKVKIVKVNVDENPVTATKLSIMSIPTLILFRDGKIVEQIVGSRSKSDLAAFLDAKALS